MYLLLFKKSIVLKECMFCIAYHCFYPALELFSSSMQLMNHVNNSAENSAFYVEFSVLHMIYEGYFMTLVLLKIKKSIKLISKR